MADFESSDIFGGASPAGDGHIGVVPPPKAGDQTKFLRGDRTWADEEAGATGPRGPRGFSGFDGNDGETSVPIPGRRGPAGLAVVDSFTLTPAATLPAAPVMGMHASVTTATTPAIGALLSLGGAAFAEGVYNGSQWTVTAI